MKHTLYDTRHFLRAMAVWIPLGAVVILATEQKALHLWFNAWNHPVSDEFFKYATRLAEGLFAGSIALLVFFYKIRYGVVATISFAGAGLLAQLFKRTVFDGIKRPSKVFEGLTDLHFVDGVTLHGNFSFPSGHATEAFSIFFLLGFLSRNRAVEYFCFSMALLVAFSRVYLSQHFFEDIYAGSVLGTGFTFIVIALFRDRKWGEQGLLATFDRKR